MVKDVSYVAEKIVEASGGMDNIKKMTHCATRLRIELYKDESFDQEKINMVEGVSGYFYKSGQHQIILGTGFVNKVYADLLDKGAPSEDEGSEEDSAQPSGNRLQQIMKTFAGIFIPVIPILIATGMLMGLRGLLVDGLGLELSDTLLQISQVLTDTAFTFIPVFITWSAMRQFGGSPIIGIALGLMLVSPVLPSKWDVTFGEAEPLLISLLGFDLPITGMQSTILPAIFMGWIATKIEKAARKAVPELLDLILTPFITLFFSMILGLIIVGPVILGIEELLSSVILFFFQLPFGMGGLVYGGFIQILTITGMHHTMVPISVQMVAESGYDIINPIGTAAIAGQAGAGIAVILKQRSKLKKANMTGSVIPAFFGITEPVMFAINLPKVSPFIYGCIGGAVGGWLAAILGIAAAGTGTTMIPGLLLYIGDGFLQYILVILTALATAFIFTTAAFREPQPDEALKRVS
jgi:sucrose PTS system EIIBCA or EIIBC component